MIMTPIGSMSGLTATSTGRALVDVEQKAWFNLADLAKILQASPDLYDTFINKTNPEKYASGQALGADENSEWLSFDQTTLLIFCFMTDYPSAQRFVERLQLEVLGNNSRY